MRIAALATGVGNVRSVVRALEKVVPRSFGETSITLTSDPEVVRTADVLVVPGQGSFGAFVSAIDAKDLRSVLRERIGAGVPFLGICLGLQVLFEASDEAEGAEGLGVLPGRVLRLEPGIDPDTGRERLLPHIGWNRAIPRDEASLVAPDHYYFAHTFAAVPTSSEVILSTTEYGASFVSAVQKDNIVGIQFHPEKSQRAGLAVLERFFLSVVKGSPNQLGSGGRAPLPEGGR